MSSLVGGALTKVLPTDTQTQSLFQSPSSYFIGDKVAMIDSNSRIPIVGSFTWLNNKDTPSWSRIDRLLVSPYWEAQFLDLFQKRRPRLCSDHFPILLAC